ncbi:MAG: 2-oxoacid:acceptor oxidoreductase family protein [Bdellovibrio sp.]|nr:2-oxoacid:acceptor oxidoreductase family protein [Bdellovibrio sp.]
MIGIRIHGRGGQGGVVSSKILALAFHADGICPQTFPKYGVERRGAPAAAFVRLSKSHTLIPLRCEIYHPHHLIVLDETLLQLGDTLAGLLDRGWIVVNSIKQPSAFTDLKHKFKVATIDVTSIALRRKLGTELAPIVNSAILGAFAKIFQAPKIESLEKAICKMIPSKQLENAQAAREAYEQIQTGTIQ